MNIVIEFSCVGLAVREILVELTVSVEPSFNQGMIIIVLLISPSNSM